MTKPTRLRKAKAASTRKTAKRARPKPRAARGKARKGKTKTTPRKAAPKRKGVVAGTKRGGAPKRPVTAAKPEPRAAVATHPLEGPATGPEPVQREPHLPGTGTDHGGKPPADDADEPAPR